MHLTGVQTLTASCGKTSRPRVSNFLRPWAWDGPARTEKSESPLGEENKNGMYDDSYVTLPRVLCTQTSRWGKNRVKTASLL